MTGDPRGAAAELTKSVPIRRLLGRELRLAARHGGDTAAAALFFLLAGSLFPLGVGPEPEMLRRIAPGIVWVCALLAALLPLDRLFGADHEDGSLDLLLLSGPPASLIAATKALAHWLTTGVPLLAASVPLAAMLRAEPDVIARLVVGLVPGTAVLSLLGTMAAAIVIGARRGGVLLPLLVLPLAAPVVIFGVASADPVDARAPLLLLAALLSAAIVLCPLAAGAALRAAME